MAKTELTAENLIKARLATYSDQIAEVRTKIEAIDVERKRLEEYGKQLTGALNAMQDILKDTNDASIIVGIKECSGEKPSSA